jgi:hypothetical protein
MSRTRTFQLYPEAGVCDNSETKKAATEPPFSRFENYSKHSRKLRRDFFPPVKNNSENPAFTVEKFE